LRVVLSIIVRSDAACVSESDVMEAVK